MRSTEHTSRFVLALQSARNIDLEKLAGSGLDVTVTDYTSGQPVVGPVTLMPEFCDELLSGLRYALEKTIERRVEWLESDLRAAKKVIGIQEIK